VNKFILLTAVFFCGLFTQLAFAQSVDRPASDLTIEKLAAHLGVKAFQTGQFSQQRTLQGFSRKLQSSGRFYFWRDHGLYWETQKPFFRALSYGGGQVVGWDIDGEVVSQQRTGIIQQQVNKVLMAMLGADLVKLQQLFKVEINTAIDQRWRLQLTPRDLAVAKGIKSIELNGLDTIEQAIVIAPSGDRSIIDFSDMQQSAVPTVDACRKFIIAMPKTDSDRCQ